MKVFKFTAWTVGIVITLLLLVQLWPAFADNTPDHSAPIQAEKNQNETPAEFMIQDNNSPWIVYNVHIDLPPGSLIDYLRIYYDDTSTSDSIAWITSYDGAGSYSDVVNVSSADASGYGTNLSAFVGVVPDYLNNSYVLNWRPNTVGPSMQLCGLRVAYHLPAAGDFSYLHVAGSALRPRDSAAGWDTDGSGGCIFTTFNRVFLPIAIHQ